MTLGDYLIQQGEITQEQLRIALDEQIALSGKELLGEILVRLGFTHRGVITSALNAISPAALVKSQSLDSNVPADYLEETRTVVMDDGMGKALYVSTLHHDPDEVFEFLRKFTGREIIPHPASTEAILERLKENQSSVGKIGGTTATLATEDNINRVLNTLIQDAHRIGASDIHFEPQDQTMLVRYRLDMVLRHVTSLPLKQATRLTSRIKDLARVDVAQKRKPLDGSFSLELQGRSVDFRVATMPLPKAEMVAIRILDRERNLKNINELGITEVEEWKDIVSQHDGLVLVCGPTGSGKTTTLYSTIQHMDRLHKSVNTIEDPIEYRLSFCNQAQVNVDTGFTFAQYTKSVVRQDPDVIVIGETRDPETANNSVYLATTGHLVLTTLHTGNVKTSINRLVAGMGVDKQLLAYVLRGVMVQRLARTLCPLCGKKGCEHCHHTGYRGLTLLTEYARIKSPSDLDRILNGDMPYYTFADDVKHKLKMGITDEEELKRVYTH